MVRCSCPPQDAERPMSFLLLSCTTIVNLPLIKIPENATHVVLGEYLGILQYDTTMDNSHTLLWTEVLNYSPRFSNVQQSLGFVPYGPMFLPPRQDAERPMFYNYCEISGNYATYQYFVNILEISSVKHGTESRVRTLWSGVPAPSSCA